MKKAFYLFGVLYFMFEISVYVVDIIRVIKERFEHEDVNSESKIAKNKKPRQPIGFAVETTEC